MFVIFNPNPYTKCYVIQQRWSWAQCHKQYVLLIECCGLHYSKHIEDTTVLHEAIQMVPMLESESMFNRRCVAIIIVHLLSLLIQQGLILREGNWLAHFRNKSSYVIANVTSLITLTSAASGTSGTPIQPVCAHGTQALYNKFKFKSGYCTWSYTDKIVIEQRT